MDNALVVDDDRTVREMVVRSLKKIGIEATAVATAQAAIEIITESSPDVIVLDIVLPSISGLDAFRQFRQIDAKVPVIFITSGTDSDTAIEAMQLGAFDYLTKPLDLTRLNELVSSAIESRRMMNTPVALPISNNAGGRADQFVGRSPQMLNVYKAIGRVASENVTVLIRGESGTGKELVARAIYQHSDRSDELFLAINCAALTETLLESELFGHEKGAFTGAEQQRIGKFEQCNGGTIFLDEVGDMSQLIQGKVLRLLQQQEFERVGGNKTIKTDVRIIAATNRDLEAMVEEETFRGDLFYRLNGMTVNLPPLRERDEDIPLLIEHYMNLVCEEMQRDDIEGISPEALEVLISYHWPGNVRELQSVVRQTLLNCTGPVIVPAFLPRFEDEHPALPITNGNLQPENLTTAEPTTSIPGSDLQPFVESRLQDQSTDLYAETLEAMERYLITRVLNETGGNQTKAAEILGITRGKIRDRVAQFGISLEKKVSLEDE